MKVLKKLKFREESIFGDHDITMTMTAMIMTITIMMIRTFLTTMIHDDHELS